MTSDLASFVFGLQWPDVPAPARRRLAFLLRDFAAVTVAGRRTETAAIAADHAAAESGGGAATALLDGRRLGCTGAAFANGVLANALDYDDGHRLVKGHPGANVIPAALAVAEATDASLDELLAAIAVGYEVAIRAGIALHGREAEYHASGAWGGLGAAASCARLLGLDADRLGHALGLAEYHAPIAPIMRSVAAPAMTKDACSWGALVGTTSALLAERGFTALPSVFAEGAVADLGERWHVLDMYVKQYPCCRWTQPAIEAALELAGANGLDPGAIDRIEIRSFGAFAGLAEGVPATTEEAQYSLGWPVAVALAHGRFGVEDVEAAALADTRARALSARTVAVVEPEFEREFPARRLGALAVDAGGETLRTDSFEAPGEPDDPRWEEIVTAKLERHALPVLGDCPPLGGVERVGGRGADGLLRLLAGVTEEAS